MKNVVDGFTVDLKQMSKESLNVNIGHKKLQIETV